MLYSHSTSSIMRLLTDGGTPLLAIQRYAPISALLTLVKFNVSPKSFSTAITYYYCYYCVCNINGVQWRILNFVWYGGKAGL